MKNLHITAFGASFAIFPNEKLVPIGRIQKHRDNYLFNFRMYSELDCK